MLVLLSFQYNASPPLPLSLHIALNLVAIIVADLAVYSMLEPQFVFSKYNYNFSPYFLEE